MLDRNGNRINRRNPQDIFTPLYNKQIRPGAAAVVHYRLDVPKDVTGPVELDARVRYRKFDYEYMKLVHEGKEPPKLPIVDMCADKVTLPVAGGRRRVPAQESPVKPAWQRWNDYGIASLLEGGGKHGNFKQAEEAFKKLLTLGDKAAVPNGHLNLARVYIEEGRLDEAAAELDAAGKCDPPAPAWSRAWFTALVNTGTASRKEQIDAVIADLERLLDPDAQPADRKFDFTKDYVVWNALANRLYKRRQYEAPGSPARTEFLLRAVKAAEQVLGWRPRTWRATTRWPGASPNWPGTGRRTCRRPALGRRRECEGGDGCRPEAAGRPAGQGVCRPGGRHPGPAGPAARHDQGGARQLEPAFHAATDPRGPDVAGGGPDGAAPRVARDLQAGRGGRVAGHPDLPGEPPGGELRRPGRA